MFPWLDIIMTIGLLALFLGLCFLAGRYTRARDVKKVLSNARIFRLRPIPERLDRKKR